MANAEIMVVEDESITAADIEASLTRLGYRVPQVAHSGEEAIEKAASFRPDLVLMDIRLKGEMDGIQAAEQLRTRFGIPVTYLTAYADDATLARAQQTAPFGYLVKPFDERELHATIQMALHCRELERRAGESQTWLSSILGAVGDGIIATDADGHVRFMSRVAESLTGWRQPEAMGKPLARVFCTAPLTENATEGTSDGPRQPHPGEPEQLLLLHKSGKEVPIEMMASAAGDEKGEITGFVWAFRDISSRRRAEAELREKEEHFRSLIEQTSDIITVVDQDGTIYYASPSVEPVLGYIAADVLGKSILEVVHPDDSRTAVLTLTRLFSGRRTTARLDVRVQHHDGSWRVMESVGSRRTTGPGETRIVLSSRDVTDRKEAEARLTEELESSAALAKMAQQLIAELGTEDLLQHLCRTTTEVLQCDFSHTWLYDEADGTYVIVAGHGDTQEQRETLRALRLPPAVGTNLRERTDAAEVTQFIAGETPDLVPPSIPARYGITSSMFMALRRRGRMVGLHTAGYRGRTEPFSTQQRQMAKRIAHLASLALEHARLVEELDTASRLKSDLMATLSQELRTPLATILSAAQLLLEGEFGPLKGEQSERLAVIERISRQMAEIVETTLDLGRAEHTQVRLEIRETAVESLIAEIKRESESLWRHDDVSLDWNTEQWLPVLRTDRVKLKVVIKNLVSNALKFTLKGRVSVTARAQGKGIEFSVSDTGPGIPPEAQTTIFEPYRQGGGPEGSAQEGISLGLYIARQLVDMLGGRIELESEPGRGSTFRVWVPLAPPTAHPRGTES